MKLVGRIPVEPLDDERLTNIERRIVIGASDAAALQPLRASRLPLVLGFAIVAVAVMGAGLVGWRMRGGSDPALVAEVTPLQVHTDQQSSLLDIGDARIESSPATSFTVTRPGDGVLVAMTRGRVELEVGKRGKRAPLVVRAGETDVIVVGTHFSVDFGDGTGDVDVRVTEGVVRVVRQQQETRVAAGQAWKTQRGLVALADAGPGATIGDRERTGSDAIEIDMGKAPDLLHDRVSQIPGTRIPTGSGQGANNGAGSNTTPGAHVVTGPDHGKPHTLDNPSDPQFDLKTAIRRQVVLPALDIHTPNAMEAMSEYRKTAYTAKGDDASLALYSIAYVQAIKLGRTEDAISTLDAYTRRFKGGNEYVAALWLRVRTLCLRQIDNVCRAAAYTYVHEAGGDTPTAHVAERITMSQ